MVQFGMVGKLMSKPEDRDTILALLSEGVEAIRPLEGCQSYIVSKDINDAGTIWVMELWDSKEAHDASLTLPEVRAIISRAMPYITGTDGASLIPVTGKGL